MVNTSSHSGSRSFSTFPTFLVTVFFWSVAFAGSKFFLKNLTFVGLHEDPAVLLEKVVGYVSIGAALAYAIGGSISSVLPKRTLIVLTSALAILVLLAEYSYGQASPVALIATGVTVGMLYGLYAVVRSVVACIEIEKTRTADTVVNGLVTVLLIIGLIIGPYVSTRFFELIGPQTIWVFVAMFSIITVAAFFLPYGRYETRVPFYSSITKTWKEACWISAQRPTVLLASAALWSVSTIVGLKSVPYTFTTYGILESEASLIVVYSALGIIFGNLLTMSCKNRWLFYRLHAIALSCMIFFFRTLTTSYPLMIAYSVTIGVFIGASTNLVDSYFLQFIGKHNVKENGAALNGVILNAMMAGLFFSLRFVPENLHFIFLGCVSAAMVLLLHVSLNSLRQSDSIVP